MLKGFAKENMTRKLVRTETSNSKMQKGTQQNRKDKRDGIDYSPGVGFDQKNDATTKTTQEQVPTRKTARNKHASHAG